MTTFNINDYVCIKLTDYGRECLRQNWEALNKQTLGKLAQVAPYQPKTEDKDGWSKWQLWNLMEELGPHISLGGRMPFEANIQL